MHASRVTAQALTNAFPAPFIPLTDLRAGGYDAGPQVGSGNQTLSTSIARLLTVGMN